jgi:hypothetical protein
MIQPHEKYAPHYCQRAGTRRLRAVRTTAAGTADITISSLRFIGEQRLPWRQPFQGTVVGGLSGIDYDAANDEWVMISDDRSQINPALLPRQTDL